MKSENIHGKVKVGNVRDDDDDVNLIKIDCAIKSDINQLQPIEFDIIYIPVDITNQRPGFESIIYVA